MTRTWMAGLAALTALAAAAPAARAQQTDADRWSWHGALARGKTVDVSGISGTIRAEASTGSEVEVSAVKRGSAGDRAEVHIEMTQDAGGVTVCALYGEGGSCRSGNRHSHVRDNDASVDFVVRVPAGVRFDGAMVSGDVEVAGLDAPVSVHSVSGDVTVRNVRADVAANSVSGSATLAAVDGRQVTVGSVSGDVAFGGPVHADGRYTFHTVSGNVTLNVDGAMSAHIALNTVSGDLDSDFPVTLAAGSRMHVRNVEFSVGSGDARIDLSTVSGDIHLRRGAQSGR